MQHKEITLLDELCNDSNKELNTGTNTSDTPNTQWGTFLEFWMFISSKILIFFCKQCKQLLGCYMIVLTSSNNKWDRIHDLSWSSWPWVACCKLYYLNDCIFPLFGISRVSPANSFIIMYSWQKGLFESKVEQFCGVIRLEGPCRGHQVSCFNFFRNVCFTHWRIFLQYNLIFLSFSVKNKVL